jgi:two-component system sensor histidine kinase KdpD
VIGVIAGGIAGGVLSVVAGFLVFDFAYIPPYNTLSVGAGQNWAPLGVYVIVMLLVAQVVSHLRTARANAQRREDEARRLFALSELVVENGSLEELLETVVGAISTVFEVEGVALLLPDDNGLVNVASAGVPLSERELAALEPGSGVPVRVGTAGSADARLRTHVLSSASGPVGMLALKGLSERSADDAALRTFANHAALALERIQLHTKAQKSELLEEVDKVRRDLVGAVSHDLRTPLATMKVASSTLLDSNSHLSSSETRELYALLDVQTDRLTRLVTSLLEMNRYETGVLQLERRPTIVLDLVGDALAGLRPALGDREVELDLPASLPSVDVDPVLMGQVLVNLLDNAERHSPEGEAIRVDAEVVGDRVMTSVIDKGKGVPPDERSTVFQSFVQFDTGGRAGLGLAIAKAFVDAHGQEIWVEDAPGAGARFVFSMAVTRSSNGT